MQRSRRFSPSLKLACRSAALALLLPACRATPAPIATVRITSPVERDTVAGPAVHVTLAVSGIELAPVAEQRPGTAHHHLYLDVDVGDLAQPIPVGLPGIIHLGQAQTEFHWDSVAPGPHRIIAVLADPAHIPLRPLVVDSVRFVVRGER
jgi:hypothetical protein